MVTLNRNEVIKYLITDDIDITNQLDGYEYLYGILKSGFIGYDKMSDKELKEEYLERIDPDKEVQFDF